MLCVIFLEISQDIQIVKGGQGYVLNLALGQLGLDLACAQFDCVKQKEEKLVMSKLTES